MLMGFCLIAKVKEQTVVPSNICQLGCLDLGGFMERDIDFPFIKQKNKPIFVSFSITQLILTFRLEFQI